MLPTPRMEEMPYTTWPSRFEETLTACLKALLEGKHLYQSATVELEERENKADQSRVFVRAVVADWGIHGVVPLPPTGPIYDITLKTPDVKLFCDQCERVEAFNSIATQEFTGRHRQEPEVTAKDEAIQLFVLSFLCQSCKGVPEVFLVRRQGLKLTLCGRAPMEVAQVPPVIPKAVQQYYSGAMVAHQSGQTLAGLFLLRTLVEQWARSRLEKPLPSRADELMDRYMATLPVMFKQQFPSMRKVYDDISADIHNALGSGELFDSASADIVEHFDARRLFKL